jgi:transposase
VADDERTMLAEWARQRATDASRALRARIILACATGMTNKEVAARLQVWPHTVGKWRGRFVRDRLAGLSDEPRPGAVRKLSPARIEAIIEKTLEEAPTNGVTHWSTRSMAAAVRLNQTAISRIWRLYGLRPHETDTWRLFRCHRPGDGASGLAGLYPDPRHQVLAVAYDIRAARRTGPFPLGAGNRLRGTDGPSATARISVPSAADGTPNVPGQLRCCPELVRFLEDAVGRARDGVEIHLAFVCRTAADAARWTRLAEHPRIVVHPIPALSSWYRLTERWAAGLAPRTWRLPQADAGNSCATRAETFTWPGSSAEDALVAGSGLSAEDALVAGSGLSAEDALVAGSGLSAQDALAAVRADVADRDRGRPTLVPSR